MTPNTVILPAFACRRVTDDTRHTAGFAATDRSCSPASDAVLTHSSPTGTPGLTRGSKGGVPVTLVWILAVAAGVLPGLAALLGYLGGNAFPQPLSPAEEADQIRRLRAGEAEARRCLIEHNLRLVAHIVKKFDATGDDQDDLISIGTIGLIKAIDTFDPAKGVRLATYAARCVENEILMHLRNTKRQRSEVSLYDPIGVDREGNEITLVDLTYPVSAGSARISTGGPVPARMRRV
jgi:hypothetical protein